MNKNNKSWLSEYWWALFLLIPAILGIYLFLNNSPGRIISIIMADPMAQGILFTMIIDTIVVTLFWATIIAGTYFFASYIINTYSFVNEFAQRIFGSKEDIKSLKEARDKALEMQRI